jgi:hypothetical protein
MILACASLTVRPVTAVIRMPTVPRASAFLGEAKLLISILLFRVG